MRFAPCFKHQSPLGGLRSWPCQKRWWLIFTPCGRLCFQTTFISIAPQGQRQRIRPNRCSGRTLDWALFSWNQAKARCYQSCSDVCPCRSGISMDEHLNLLSIWGQQMEGKGKYPWPFLVGSNPRLSSFANIPMASASAQDNQEAHNFKPRLIKKSSCKVICKWVLLRSLWLWQWWWWSHGLY